MKTDSDKKNSKIITLEMFGVVFVIIAVIFAIWFFLNGEKIVSGGFPEVIRLNTLDCKIQNESVYKILGEEKTDSRSLEIKAIYNEQELNSIALTYILYYGDTRSIDIMTPQLKVALDKSFEKDNLSPSALSSNWSSFKNGLELNLYATRSEITDNSAKYFLLDFGVKNPLTLDSMKDAYEKNGFLCKVIDK